MSVQSRDKPAPYLFIFKPISTEAAVILADSWCNDARLQWQSTPQEGTPDCNFTASGVYSCAFDSSLSQNRTLFQWSTYDSLKRQIT